METTAASLTRQDLELLVRAAQAAGLDTGRLRSLNPWSFEGAVAKTLQAAVIELDPAAAERMQQAAGVTLSLGAQAALEGIGQLTPALEAELAERAPASFASIRQQQIDAAEAAAYGAFQQRQTEAEARAAAVNYNVARLSNAGDFLASQAAAKHWEQVEAAERQQRMADAAWLRRQEQGANGLGA